MLVIQDNRTPIRRTVDVELARRNMNLTDLARALGKSAVYISDVLNGARKGEKAKAIICEIKSLLNIAEYEKSAE